MVDADDTVEWDLVERSAPGLITTAAARGHKS